VLAAIALGAGGCGSSSKPAPPPKVEQFQLNSKLMGRPLYETLVTPAGGGKGRPLLVFLHGYGAAPSDMVTPAFVAGLRRLGARAPVVVLPEGDTGWWHDDGDGPWGSYVLREVIPVALRRSGADPHRVAIGGISMGGFGALDLARLAPGRFCAVGAHAPAILRASYLSLLGAFDDGADFARHDLLAFAAGKRLYRIPLYLDVGRDDALRSADTEFANAVRRRGTKTTFRLVPGGHSGWGGRMSGYLRWYAGACD